MENIFNNYKGMKITHPTYSGIVCGYNDDHFILGVEGTHKLFFRKLPKNSVISIEQFKDSKYKYMYENESELIKQLNEQNCKK